jgi:hypothetical protein
MGKSKVWKKYKNVSGGKFSEFWEELDNDARDEWYNEKEKRRLKRSKNETGSTTDKQSE